jgi:hypothetical protein
LLWGTIEEDRGRLVARQGGREAVQVKRLVSKRIRKAGSGIDLVADLGAAVSVNVNETGTTTTTTSRRTGTEPPAPSRGDEEPDRRGRETS